MRYQTLKETPDEIRSRVCDRVDRDLGQIMSTAGLILIGGFAALDVATLSNFAPAWVFLCSVIIGFLAVTAFAGHVLPMGFLRVGWVLVPLLSMVALVTTYFAYRGLVPEEAFTWQSITIPAVLVFFVLWLPAKWTIICSIIMILMPAISSLLALGPIVTSALTNTPNLLAGVGMVLLFIVIRQSLVNFRQAEAEAEDQELRRAHAVARANEEARIARLVHDEVLASLSAALHADGTPSVTLRAGAERALRVLEAEYPGATFADLASSVSSDASGVLAASHAASMPRAELCERLRTLTKGLGVDCAVDLQTPGGEAEIPVPAVIAEILVAATSEALRNSVRHAGDGAARQLRCVASTELVRIEVIDNGVGFDIAAIDPRRLGVRRSILATVEALQQGSASVISAPGDGTRVVLQWTS